MKKIFEEDFSFNTLGSNLAQSFGKLLDDWIKDNDLKNVNPIELAWLIQTEVDIRMAELYLDAATKID